MTSLPFLEQKSGTLFLRVHVKPNQRKQALFFALGDNSLTAQVKAPPEKGKANKELIKLLAKSFSIPTTALAIVSGVSSKDKIVAITQISEEQIKEQLLLLRLG